MENIFYVALGLLLVVGVVVFLYILLFKSRESNYPMAGRGLGIALLAGVLKVVFLLMAEKVSPIFDSTWVNGALVVMLVVGILMMMSGFASGD